MVSLLVVVYVTPAKKDENIYEGAESYQVVARESPHVTEECDDEKFHLNPLTNTNDDRDTFNKKPFWRCDTLQGTS